MLRWMCGKIRQNRIRNDNIRESWSSGSTYRRKDGGNFDYKIHKFCSKESMRWRIIQSLEGEEELEKL